ncbi:unnamed protein product [Closterium sp. NIES-64]|nr:unnamed protein product [Closterium sp. NIES-64]
MEPPAAPIGCSLLRVAHREDGTNIADSNGRNVGDGSDSNESGGVDSSTSSSGDGPGDENSGENSGNGIGDVKVDQEQLKQELLQDGAVEDDEVAGIPDLTADLDESEWAKASARNRERISGSTSAEAERGTRKTRTTGWREAKTGEGGGIGAAGEAGGAGGAGGEGGEGGEAEEEEGEGDGDGGEGDIEDDDMDLSYDSEDELEVVLLLRIPRNMAELRAVRATLALYKREFPLRVVVIFVNLYLFLQSFCIPGTICMNLLAGSLFGFFPGLFTISILISAGACASYTISHFLLRDIVYYYFPDKCDWMRAEVQRHYTSLIYYVISLRITPIMPTWVVNLCSPLVGIPIRIYLIGTFFGFIPSSVIQVKAGCVLSTINSLSDLYDAPTIAALFLVAILALVPPLSKTLWAQRLWAQAMSNSTVAAFVSFISSLGVSNSGVGRVSYSPLRPHYSGIGMHAAAHDYLGAEEVGAASAPSGKRRSGRGSRGGRGGGGGGGGGTGAGGGGGGGGEGGRGGGGDGGGGGGGGGTGSGGGVSSGGGGGGSGGGSGGLAHFYT